MEISTRLSALACRHAVIVGDAGIMFPLFAPPFNVKSKYEDGKPSWGYVFVGYANAITNVLYAVL